MLKIVAANKAEVLAKIVQGRISGALTSAENFVETIMKKMQAMGILEALEHIVTDTRACNATIPMRLLWTLAITAKMKVKTSMTDIPCAIEDAELLAALGYTLVDREKGVGKGLLDEGELRHLFGSYPQEEFIAGYNGCVQRHILPQAGVVSDIHLLDCTKIDVCLNNTRYEDSTVVHDAEGARRGYKLATLRGIVGDGGVIEEIRMGTMSEHDLSLSQDMLRHSPQLKPGDVLINDRGFISRDIMNELKRVRQVDTYVPLKKNMVAYDEALRIVKLPKTTWYNHPNKKRPTQKIAFASDLGTMWRSDTPEHDVPLNGCVVHDLKDDEYYVFITTDTAKTARQIILAYEMRPEIEEDYRQLKDFWHIEDFKSTSLCLITFHIIATLLGYLLFQLYVGTDEGRKYAGKSLPVILKNYDFHKQSAQKPRPLIIFAGHYFGIFPFLEFISLYASLSQSLRTQLDTVLATV
jgi:hypothetical protein